MVETITIANLLPTSVKTLKDALAVFNYERSDEPDFYNGVRVVRFAILNDAFKILLVSAPSEKQFCDAMAGVTLTPAMLYMLWKGEINA